ncbi:MAG: hypothetical protein HY888_07760 [Deltaproteobacteria bacterium]|nr:hypothetical protein [Deltaproteobacteria bacterium]
MALTVDRQKISALISSPVSSGTADVLRRQGNVFFVGGNLPVYETLETMFESYCMESTGLFHLTFGDSGNLQRGLEMARLIKKNFSVRLMGRLDYPVPAETVEQIYAAGVDILDIPLPVCSSASDSTLISDHTARQATLDAARLVFPGWSVVASLEADQMATGATMAVIDSLLAKGIMPLVSFSGNTALKEPDDAAAVFSHLASGWKKHHVPVKTLLPLITLITPLVPREEPGLVRGFIDRIRDRHQLASSDLQRRLRVGQAADSLDSAEL